MQYNSLVVNLFSCRFIMLSVISIFTYTNRWVEFILICSVLFTIFYYYSISTFGKWKKLNVPYVHPIPLFGNYFNVALGIENQAELYKKIYYKLAGHKYGGMFQMRTPYLFIRNPEMINNILIKDFSYFPNRGIHTDYSINPLSNNLFWMENPQWKIIRNKLTPAFTSGKLKVMYDQIKECSDELMVNIYKQLETNPNEIDVRDVLGKYSTDVIGTCAFGLKLNAVSDNKSEFRKYGKTLFEKSIRYLFKDVCVMISPSLMSILKLRDFPMKAIDFFRSVFHETILYREKNNIIRHDLVHSLMQARNDLVLNNKLPTEERFTELQIVANAFAMFAAGFETVSTVMSYCLQELALKKHIQDKVREEIKIKMCTHSGVINNDFLNDLHYLDMVIAETLRKYPVTHALFRKASKTYHVPNDTLIIEKNQKIIIPIYSLHYDHKYFKDPEVFNPERFSPEEKVKIPAGVYLPFGDGPRICIGKRFAEIEMKLALVEILSKFEVEPCDNTEVPIRFSCMTMITVPSSGSVWLKLIPIIN